jgi:translation initiation factor IF-2
VAKTRIYELARELGLESKDVLDQALALGLEVKTASSSLEPQDADLIRLAFVPDSAPSAEAPSAPEPAPEPKPAAKVEEAPAPAPPAPPVSEPVEDLRILSFVAGGTVADFAEAVGHPVPAVFKQLMLNGAAVGANQPMPIELIETIGEALGAVVVVEQPAPKPVATTVKPKAVFDEPEGALVSRPPVVTVMGHVDHGKTTLLDTIRKTKVVAGEQGGITQHIGAYQVDVGGNQITFIDTPGHAAFSAMRARGAEVTDIVVLVVAANDGVMPQTIEAISHAKAAGVQLVVAINKIDLPGADPFRVRTMLTEHDVITEDLGGDVPSVELSALTGLGVDNLLEVIDLIAQIQEYKANPTAPASGVVIESQLDPGMGPTATVVIQRGTLRLGDAFVSGPVAGRVRALMDHAGGRIKEAGPSIPVLVMGWSDVPTAGDSFEALASDREARALADERMQAIKELEHRMPTARDRLQNLLDQLRGEETELRVILKADTHGSVEALREALTKITREDASVDVVHSAVGGINENDVTLAEVTDAIIIGFNVRPEGKARKAAEAKGIEIRTYGIIYELLEDLERILVGSLTPDSQEVVLGTAEIRALFKVPRMGTVAGCYVTEGVIQRNAKVRLIRQGVVIHTGSLGSLRRFKDDVREVATGFECGIGIDGYNDLKEGDLIEAFVIREVART